MAGKMRTDLTGRTFTHLLVLKRSSQTGNGLKPVVMWECQCNCGMKVVVKSDSLLSEHLGISYSTLQHRVDRGQPIGG